MSEKIFKRWDAWRKYYKEGGTASWPRDEFENIIENFEEETKALRETSKSLDDGAGFLLKRLIEVKQIRDELLEALKLSVETEIDEGWVFKNTIKRAEALKEKNI